MLNFGCIHTAGLHAHLRLFLTSVCMHDHSHYILNVPQSNCCVIRPKDFKSQRACVKDCGVRSKITVSTRVARCDSFHPKQCKTKHISKKAA